MTQIDQAYVEVLPDLAKFDRQLKSGLDSAFARAEASASSAASSLESEFEAAASDAGQAFDGLAGDIERGAESVDLSGLSEGFDDAGSDSGSSFLGGFDASMLAAGGVAAIGAAAAAIAVEAFGEALAQEDFAAGFAAQTGATSAEAAAFASDIEAAYLDGWDRNTVGEFYRSILAVDDPRVESQLNDDIASLVGGVADVFDIEGAQLGSILGRAVSDGAVPSVEEGLDLITAALQGSSQEVGEEILSALSEYGPVLDDLGLTAEDFLALTADSASAIEVDAAADSLKELNARVSNDGAQIIEGLDSIGLAGDDLVDDLLAGGPQGAEAVDQIATALLGVEDPGQRAAVASELFGTRTEDIDLESFLSGLAGMDQGLGNVEGTAAAAGDLVGGTLTAQFETFKRQALDVVVDAIETYVIPAIEELVRWFNESLIPTMVELYETWQPIIDLVVEYFQYLVDQISALMEIVIGVIRTAMAVLTGDWSAAWDGIKQVVDGVWQLITNLIGFALSAISTVIGSVLGAIASVFSSIWNAIAGTVRSVVNGIKSFLSGAWAAIRSSVSNAWNAVKTTIGDAMEGARSFVSDKIDAVVGFFSGLPSRIGSAFSTLGESILSPFRWAFDQIKSLWNNSVGRLSFTVPSWVPGIGGKGWSVPQLADGGFVNAPTLAMIGEAGRELVLPLTNRRRTMSLLDQAGFDVGVGGERRGEWGEATMIGQVVHTQIVQDATDADLVAQASMAALNTRRLTAA